VWWVYPPGCNGLKLPEQALRADGPPPTGPLDVFAVRDEHRPIPCLLRPLEHYDRFVGNEVELVGRVVSAPPEVVMPLVSHLDRFQTNVLSHSVRPFGNTSSLLAIDLPRRRRDGQGAATPRRLPHVVTVQGAITMRELNEAEAAAFFGPYWTLFPTARAWVPSRNLLRRERGRPRCFKWGPSVGVRQDALHDGRLRGSGPQERRRLHQHGYCDGRSLADVAEAGPASG